MAAHEATLQEQLIIELTRAHDRQLRTDIGCELMGLAFLRSFGGDEDQRAWQTCRDPFRMMHALAEVGQAGPIRAITKGVEWFLDDTRNRLEEMAQNDWMRHVEAEMALNRLNEMLGSSGSIKAVCEEAIRARGLVDSDPAGELAHCIFLALPVGPHRFSLEELEDAELVRRLQRCAERLEGMERQWLMGLVEKVEKNMALNTRQRDQADEVLRSLGAYFVYADL